VDGGSGLLEALGARFLDRLGRKLPPGGLFLRDLHRIDLSGLDGRLRRCRIVVASDVENRLLGPLGAARVFAPQKGATPGEVKILEEGLCRFAEVAHRQFGIRLDRIKGGGAAGGVGAALVGLLGARLISGAELILRYSHFEKRLRGAVLIISAEGIFDHTSLHGKAPYKVLCLAKTRGLLCGLVCARYTLPRRFPTVDFVEEILKGPLKRDSFKNAYSYVRDSTRRLILRFLKKFGKDL
jgi:glycerate kinase